MKFIVQIENFMQPHKSRKFEINPDILKNQTTMIKINVYDESQLDEAYEALFKIPEGKDAISFVEREDPDKPKSNLKWCKDRAMAYIRCGDTQNAIASFMSDMSKNDDTKNHLGLKCVPLFINEGKITLLQAQEFIQGFADEDTSGDREIASRKLKTM